MLSREARVRKKKDFEVVYKSGKLYSVKNLGLYIFSKDDNVNLRCAFSISKKISKKAVDRNKLKRRLSHILKEEIPNLKKNFDIIFTARSGIQNLNFFDLKQTVSNLLKKSNLYI